MSGISKDIAIAYSVDDNYWMQMYISMYSLLASGSAGRLSFFVLCERVDDTFKSNIEQLRQDHDFDISFIRMDNAPLAHYPLPGGLTTAIYYRLFLGSVLPQDVRRVIYIDCDTIACGPIRQLFEYDLENMAVGAIEESETFVGERLGVVPYFNSGVMLIDLERWRTGDIEKKALHFLDTEKQSIFCPDQDALNTALAGNWLKLPVRFNLHGSYCDESGPESANSDLLVIHYCGAEKPWFYATNHPYKAQFRSFLGQTPYRGYREPDRNLKNVLAVRMKSLRAARDRHLKEPVRAFRRKYLKRPLMQAIDRVRNLF